MEVRRVPRRAIVAVIAAACVALFAAGCEPLVNAPPGGVNDGDTDTFPLRPISTPSDPGARCRAHRPPGMPRPSGSFGLKSA